MTKRSDLRAFQPDLTWVKPDPNGVNRILEANGGHSNLRSEYQIEEIERRMEGGRLNIGALIRGEERCYDRGVIGDGARRGGKDIYIQLALLCNQDQKDVDRRALAGLAYANQLRNEGIPVTLYACWCSQSTLTDAICLAWADATEMGLDMLAGVMRESVFRNSAHGIMTQRGQKWARDFGSYGGNGRTIEKARRFHEVLKDAGVLTENGVVLDWDRDNEPIE